MSRREHSSRSDGGHAAGHSPAQEIVAQRVRGHALGDAGRRRRVMHGAVELPRGQRLHRIEAREQAAVGEDLALRMADAPPGAQPLQHDRTEHGVAILGTLALLDPKGHALAVDIANLEPADLAGAQARAVGHRQRRLVLDVACRGDQRGSLGHAQHDGHGARQLHRLHARHQFAAAQGGVEEELQAGQRRVERDGRRAGVDQVQLEVAQVLDGGGVGRALQELGQLANGAYVGFLGPRLQLAHAHVFDHALTQRRARAGGRVHGCSSVGERGGLPRSPTSQNHRRLGLPRPHPERVPREYEGTSHRRVTRGRCDPVASNCDIEAERGNSWSLQFNVRSAGSGSTWPST